MDWNGGIRVECEFCGGNGFRYLNESLDRTLAMCDACRDDVDRRQKFAARRSASLYAGVPGPQEP